jgi:hypothetical protein
MRYIPPYISDPYAMLVLSKLRFGCESVSAPIRPGRDAVILKVRPVHMREGEPNFVEAAHAACVVVAFVMNHSRPPAEYSAAYRLRTRATAGADRKISRSGSSSGNEFASRRIVVRLMSPCERAESRFPDSSSM